MSKWVYFHTNLISSLTNPQSPIFVNSHSIQAPLSAFACLVQVVRITNARSSSHLSLAYMLRGMDPHTPCSHVKKLKNVVRGQFNKCQLKNLKCVLQINLEPIPLQVCLLPSPNNCLLFIVTEPSQKVAQDLLIHGLVILMPYGLLPSRRVFNLAQLHNHIVSMPKCGIYDWLQLHDFVVQMITL